MPTSGGPNISGEENLVFGFDLSDTLNSYVGEPTTNILNNNILGQGNGAFLSSDSIGTYIQLANLTSSYSRFQLPSIPVSSNDTYTWSFELMSPETITGNYYFDTNEYSDQFPASNDLSRATSVHRVPSTMPAGVWQEFSLTVTMKPDLTGAYTYDFFNMLYPTFQNKKIYYRNMQFEFKDHPTQYAGQGVIRSNTQGLIDMTGNLTIDLSNVSFDSNAQMVFDGTDDQIELLNPTEIIPGTSDFTIEMVIKSDTTARMWYVSGYNAGAGPGYYAIGSENGYFIYDMKTSTGARQESTGFVAMNTGQKYHILATRNSTGLKIYINGILQASNPDVGTFNMNETTIRFGSEYGIRQYLDGSIYYYRHYDRFFNLSEIQNNYNNIKRKYGI